MILCPITIIKVHLKIVIHLKKIILKQIAKEKIKIMKI